MSYFSTILDLMFLSALSVFCCKFFFLVLTAKSVRCEAGGRQCVSETYRSPLSGAFSCRSEELNDLEVIRRRPCSTSKNAGGVVIRLFQRWFFFFSCLELNRRLVTNGCHGNTADIKKHNICNVKAHQNQWLLIWWSFLISFPMMSFCRHSRLYFLFF